MRRVLIIWQAKILTHTRCTIGVSDLTIFTSLSANTRLGRQDCSKLPPRSNMITSTERFPISTKAYIKPVIAFLKHTKRGPATLKTLSAIRL